ncbi:hypothetical protein B7P43_G02535 [Cryptotermes secundus]|uniref:DUF4817 domain-containing protein n=1 Tax=Cryptotermes secundus TaxID=105785 RepID=A0A2J7QNQ8_9NEOP|nr:hypothetical protein B7P43_G02535 [Cryptotermes secundus]
MALQQEKAFCALRFEVSRSVITVQREFRARFQKDAPHKNNISRWYRQFVETGCLCKGKSPGSRELDMPKRSAWMVLRKWLCFKPYKMRLVQTLKPAVKEKRRDICEEMKLKMEENGFVERLISLAHILSQIYPIHTIPSYLSKIHSNIVHPPPTLAPILSQNNPVHTRPSYLSKICFNIIHPLRLDLPTGLFPSGFPIYIGGKADGKRSLGRPRCRWVNNIKMHLGDIGLDGMDWIDLVRDRDQWKAFVNTVMNLRFP